VQLAPEKDKTLLIREAASLHASKKNTFKPPPVQVVFVEMGKLKS